MFFILGTEKFKKKECDIATMLPHDFTPNGKLCP